MNLPFLIAGRTSGSNAQVKVIDAPTSHAAEQLFIQQLQTENNPGEVSIDSIQFFVLAAAKPFTYYGHEVTLDTTYAIVGSFDGQKPVLATVACFCEETAIVRFEEMMRDRFNCVKKVHIQTITLLSEICGQTH